MRFADELTAGAVPAEERLRRRRAPDDADVARASDIRAREAAGQPISMEGWAFARRVERWTGQQAGGEWPDPPPDPLSTWVQALRIGELAIGGAPGELFCELGLEIKRRSPFPQTLLLELANDSIGYVSTRRAFDERGYEPESSPLAPGEGERIVETALELLTRPRA